MALLDVDGIARAALALIDERGAQGFSIRAVGRALGVTPMAIYHHVRDKAALAELVVEAVIDHHPLGPPTGDWRQDLWTVASCGRAMTLAHPGVASIRGLYDVWTPHSHEMAARWVSSWRKTGLAEDDAVLAASTSGAAISGLVSAEQREREGDPPVRRPGLPDLPDADLLLAGDLDGETRFKLGFDAMIDGLLLQLGRRTADDLAPASKKAQPPSR